MMPVRFFPFAITGGPRCGISLKAAGTMHPGVSDGLTNRALFFRGLGFDDSSVYTLNQTHSKLVRIAGESELQSSAEAKLPKSADTVPADQSAPAGSDGDGILTVNRSIIPAITVADCMPVWLFDPVSGCFGIVHSGWRGTGIVQNAIELAQEQWGARPRDFFVILGPHIRECCYTVDSERAELFRTTFGSGCVQEDKARTAAESPWPWRLSLETANRDLLLSLKVPADHITVTGECTSCLEEYGSNRREGASEFTHMAAFISWH